MKSEDEREVPEAPYIVLKRLLFFNNREERSCHRLYLRGILENGESPVCILPKSVRIPIYQERIQHNKR